MNRIVVVAVCGGALLAPARAPAQAERFELGRRLRAFEDAWEEHKDAAARQRALTPLLRATAAFFSFQPNEAGRQLDLARFALRSEKAPPTDGLKDESCYLRRATRRADPAAGEVAYTVQPFYKANGDLPAGARLRLTLWPLHPGGPRPAAPLAQSDHDRVAPPLKGRLAVKGLPEGDYRLEVKVEAGARGLAEGTHTLSLANDLA